MHPRRGVDVTNTGPRSQGWRAIQLLNYPLRSIVMLAWGYRDYQVIGGPAWMTTDRFTINAKVEATGRPSGQDY
jgi:uncharacterized protein (TIGR03435 family)